MYRNPRPIALTEKGLMQDKGGIPPAAIHTVTIAGNMRNLNAYFFSSFASQSRKLEVWQPHLGQLLFQLLHARVTIT